MYTIGFDVGSSSIKASLVEIKTGKACATTSFPDTEMSILSPERSFAEQDPELWWQGVCICSNRLLKEQNIEPTFIKAIGISYQMHGLVLVDEDHNVLRPAIIWCDSRAVTIGDKAYTELGPSICQSQFLNSPGNFTASKLRWVKENQPDIYQRIFKCMLPGDYIAMKLTDTINTTVTGLSEGILWNFQQNKAAEELLSYYEIDQALLPVIVDNLVTQSVVSEKGAAQSGLSAGTPITYRAGDQPNNALSLGVFEPGEVAATGGTSGVMYGISDQLISDNENRTNAFAHINHIAACPRIGQLLCINGAGSQYAWLRKQVALEGMGYNDMEDLLSEVPIGSDGLVVLPFGNGAERMLGNRLIGNHMLGIHFGSHTRSHLMRATLEGIAFSFVYGFKVFSTLGITPEVIKVGNDNLFQSSVFATTIASLINCPIEVIDTTGSTGAAQASMVGAGLAKSLRQAVSHIEKVKTFMPARDNEEYQSAYDRWENQLINLLKQNSWNISKK